MIIIDEIHAVTATVDGREHPIARANLCGEIDTVEGLRLRTVAALRTLSPTLGDEAAGKAFDAAFAVCEARPGNGSVGTHPVPGGEILVTRSLDA